MLKTVLLWRSGRVRERRKEKKQVCLRGRGDWGLSPKETWRRAGWRRFKGEGRAAGAEDGRSPVLPRCRREARGAEVRTESGADRGKGQLLFSVFSLSRKKLKRPEIKIMHATVSTYGCWEEAEKGRPERGRAAQNRGNGCQGG